MNLAYVAGFVDGEGSIGFGRVRTSVFPRVLVVNTDLSVLEDLKRQFGGDIKPLSRRKDGWKQGWMWRVSWRRAIEFLDAIHPWLRLKRHQAETMFAWSAVAPGCGTPWDRETLDLLVDRIHWLNAKGPKRGEDPIDDVARRSSPRRKARGK